MELGSALSPRVFRVIEKIEYLGLSTARDLSKKHIFNLIRTHLTTIPRDASVMQRDAQDIGFRRKSDHKIQPKDYTNIQHYIKRFGALYLRVSVMPA